MSDFVQKMSHDEDWKRELGHVFFARKQLIVITAAIVLAGAILIALFWPATYAASSSLMVLGKRSQISPSALDEVDLRDPKVSLQDIASELEIIRSSELIRRVVEKIQAKSGLEPLVDEDLVAHVNRFAGRLVVVGVPDSSVVHLTLQGKSPEEAETLLQMLLDEYIQYRATVFNPAGQAKFFEDQIAYYNRSLQEKVKEMLAKGDDMSPAFLDQIIAGNLERIDMLQKQLGELEVELAVSTYKDNSELMTRIQMLKAAGMELKEKTTGIQLKRMEVDADYRQAQLMNDSLDIFAKRAEEAKINDSIARSQLAGDVSILNRAKGTASLVFPNKGMVLLMGLIAAVLAGLSLGFLAEFFDHTVRRPEDIHKFTDLRVLCSLPTLK